MKFLKGPVPVWLYLLPTVVVVVSALWTMYTTKKAAT